MKRKISFIGLLLVLLVMFHSIFNFSFADEQLVEDSIDDLSPGKLSEDYINWMELPRDEQEKRIMPPVIDISTADITKTNPFMIVGQSISSSQQSFSLKDIIPNNVVVRNQGKTNVCWAFAVLASLESNLGLKDYYNGNTSRVYDFSEKHLAYTSTNGFNDVESHKYGINIKPGDVSTILTGYSYLTNGMGAVNESDMPYTDDFSKINYSEIQNKKVQTEVTDINTFAGTKGTCMNKIKEAVVKYGGVTTAIYGAQPFSECLNVETGAMYADDENKYNVNHVVTIIGWDDTYSKANFREDKRPLNDGAWIIKNSWGENYEIRFDSAEYAYLKSSIYERFKDTFANQGYNSLAETPDSVIKTALEKIGFTISDTMASVKLGNNGIMYISYDDVNVYKSLTNVTKASTSINYDNIYQYDYLEYNNYLATSATSYFLGMSVKSNVDSSTKEEYINKVGMWVLTPMKARVLICENGASLDDAIVPSLAEGVDGYETLESGYHTLEFSNEVKVSGDCTVYVECVPTELIDGNKSYIPLLSKQATVEKFKYVIPKEGETFYMSSKDASVVDLGKASSYNPQFSDYTATLKVFTKTYDKNSGEENVVDDKDKEDEKENETENENDKTNDKEQTPLKFKYTDFNSAKSTCNNFKYHYTNNDAYVIMDIEINNISIDTSRNYKYKYFLSSSNEKTKTSIPKWYECKNVKIENNKLLFSIDTRDIDNLTEETSGNSLFVYILESETIENSTNNIISKAIQITGVGTYELYDKDGNLVYQEDIEKTSTETQAQQTSYTSSTNITNTMGDTTKDNTLSSVGLPKAGINEIIFGLVFIFTFVGIAIFVLYAKIDNDMK